MEQGEQGTRRRVLEWFTRWDRARIAVGGREGASTSKTRLDGVDTRTLLTHYCPLRQVIIAALIVEDMRYTVVLDNIKHLHLQRKKTNLIL